MDTLKIAIVCGGISGEHEVSLMSASSVFNHVDRKKFEPVLLGIDKKGAFVMHARLILNPESPRAVRLNPDATPVNSDFSNFPFYPDVAFPLIHGTYGEDGCLQGFFNIRGIPFVGADVFASALCMSKSAAKKIMSHAGIPVTRFVEYSRYDDTPRMCDVSKKLGNTLFVKPNSLGSSVGISKCETEIEFKSAVAHAFEFDDKIIIEECYVGREIEFAVMGSQNIIVSPPGEILPDRAFYSYESKYDPESKTSLKIPATLPPETADKMRHCAEKAYRAIECDGFCRIDFFLGNDGGFVINEINTIPGFTKISMFPALFQHAGYTYADIITKLIECGIARDRKKKQLRRVFF